MCSHSLVERQCPIQCGQLDGVKAIVTYKLVLEKGRLEIDSRDF